ncbi:DUF4374 domain-containing protein [Galbibacter pacificus]|uniref:DUF4374 domain-containing protein n=1 Tax=Galbibacter pacificus TaxID=2996052 RepID=A0ABT6FNN0_9FLAO|nr:DUF4374 domain-containing protein [Galbibacter pacificus]MDG3581228.1 DUF4374 domain-containing protein [Galbibacter pacificus]MDG3584706.1 DUF4374 domain-containing protein [Galbibacter pacificus]
MIKQSNFYFGLIFLGATTLIGCSSDDDAGNPDDGGENPAAESQYLITATPTASEGVADYILTTDDLTQGSITTEGNGIEQDGTYRYYVTHNNKFFSLLYGQGNPGAVTTYQLNAESNLEKISDFQSETVQAFAPVNDDILMIKISRNAESPYAYWYQLDTETSQFTGEGQINTQELADKENGELAFFSWITQVGDKVYLPYFTVKACCNDTFGTDYPDEANIAVYSYPEMELETVIHDDRTSYIGRYFDNGLSVDENGDAYAFSASVATTNGELTSTKPSAITRIKSGTSEFDQDYLFDIEAASGGAYITDHIYVGNGKAIGILMDEKTSAYSTGNRLAVIDLYNQTLEWVTGMPSPETILNVTKGMDNYVSEDESTVFVGVTTEGGSFIYNIDVAGASATQGLEVEGGQITAINRLDPVE